ncbi:hypothetical protein WR25_25570 [Diploscapter pachys]|uniref:Uncharacterized protein n=1 Tax=Diploscapter pachys TaxID=2018661 RepID=A0A2A2LZT1_9BILA|nr:hypothetical protein WR25_25570 [Diploscapter pachys]
MKKDCIKCRQERERREQETAHAEAQGLVNQVANEAMDQLKSLKIVVHEEQTARLPPSRIPTATGHSATTISSSSVNLLRPERHSTSRQSPLHLPQIQTKKPASSRNTTSTVVKKSTSTPFLPRLQGLDGAQGISTPPQDHGGSSVNLHQRNVPQYGHQGHYQPPGTRGSEKRVILKTTETTLNDEVKTEAEKHAEELLQRMDSPEELDSDLYDRMSYLNLMTKRKEQASQRRTDRMRQFRDELVF